MSKKSIKAQIKRYKFVVDWLREQGEVNRTQEILVKISELEKQL